MTWRFSCLVPDNVLKLGVRLSLDVHGYCILHSMTKVALKHLLEEKSCGFIYQEKMNHQDQLIKIQIFSYHFLLDTK